jgi:hypothetical protein
MIDSKALERLHNSKDFLLFLDEVAANREALVRNLYGKSNEHLQCAAGGITAYNDLLDEAQYDRLKESWARLEQ